MKLLVLAILLACEAEQRAVDTSGRDLKKLEAAYRRLEACQYKEKLAAPPKYADAALYSAALCAFNKRAEKARGPKLARAAAANRDLAGAELMRAWLKNGKMKTLPCTNARVAKLAACFANDTGPQRDLPVCAGVQPQELSAGADLMSSG